MRVLFALALPAAAVLAACSSAPSGGASVGYQAELGTLEQQCRDRGGTPRPRPGYTAQPPLDYVCIIRDGPSEHILDLNEPPLGAGP